ncbi:unnamed protein product, partial [Polarella glacialis]
ASLGAEDGAEAKFYYIGDEKEAFARKMARMDEQLRRLKEHDWRPAQLRGEGLAATLQASAPSTSSLRDRLPGTLGRQLRSPLTRSLDLPARATTPPPSLSATSPPGVFLWPKTSSLSPSRKTSSSSNCSPTGRREGHVLPASPRKSDAELSGLVASALEQQLRSELRACNESLQKMASLLSDRDEQLRSLELRVRSPEDAQQSVAIARNGLGSPDTARRQLEQAVRDRARVEVLRAELAERDLEVEMMRESERSVERRATEELRAAGLEILETRRQQEILGLEIQEAELVHQQH